MASVTKIKCQQAIFRFTTQSARVSKRELLFISVTFVCKRDKIGVPSYDPFVDGRRVFFFEILSWRAATHAIKCSDS
jgi:hypothetical protein